MIGVADAGLGSELDVAFFAEPRSRQLHVAIGCIALPNAANIALHETKGITQVTHFKNLV